MSRYRPYPTYKDSGVEWLGRIPEHWNVAPIKHIVLIPITDGPHETPEFLDTGIPFVSAEAVSSGEIDFSKIRGCISVEDHRRYSQKYRPMRNDIFMIKSGATTGITAIVDTDMEFNIWSPLAVIRCGAKANPHFILNYLRSNSFQEAVKIYWNYGTQQNIGMGVIGDLFTVMPPVDEQRIIVAYLNCETARIDALIEKKTRFIELLREKRQALINRAITKGLDPNVTMRDSGLEWLGQVPENWEVKPIKYLTSHIGSGKTPSGGATVYQDDGVIFLRSQNIYDDGLRLDDVAYISEEIDCGMRGSRVQVGDVLLNITGASIGRTCNISKNIGPANVNQHVCIIRAHDSDISEWIAECFLSDMIKEQIKIVQNGAGREGLNFEQIGNMIITLPMATEREYINSWLKAQRGRIDTLICKTEQSIDLLKERRTALITAAVTGQIDLREVAQ